MIEQLKTIREALVLGIKAINHLGGAREATPLHDAMPALTQLEAMVGEQKLLTELQKDAVPLLFALREAWTYVHAHCTIKSRKDEIHRLIVKHGDFADYWKKYEASKQPQAETDESIAADAYVIACQEMEQWQHKRRKAGKEVGTTGSLVDGIAWLYGYVDDLESKQPQAEAATTPKPEGPTNRVLKDSDFTKPGEGR